jgi:hypothetical protein
MKLSPSFVPLTGQAHAGQVCERGALSPPRGGEGKIERALSIYKLALAFQEKSQRKRFPRQVIGLKKSYFSILVYYLARIFFKTEHSSGGEPPLSTLR